MSKKFNYYNDYSARNTVENNNHDNHVNEPVYNG